MHYVERQWPHISPDELIANENELHWPGGEAVAVGLCFELWSSDVIAEQQIVATTLDFGVKRGTHSILRMLERYGVPATFFVNGRTAERYPTIVADIVTAGHEVAPLGYDLAPHWNLDDDQIREQIANGLAAITTAGGVAPAGWRTPQARPSQTTVPLLVEAGLKWDSTLRNDEVIGKLRFETGSIIEIPFGGVLDYTTRSAFPGPVKLVPTMISDFVDDLDVVRVESERLPRMAVLNLNPSYTGRPAELAMLDTLLSKLTTEKSGTWFARFGELADWMLKNDEWFVDLDTAREKL